MSREWKPGDVAMVTCSASTCPKAEHASIRGKYDWYILGLGEYDVDAKPVRPLVVIDPENAEQVERFVRILPDEWGFTESGELRESVRQFAAALREFADPKPQKPTDPKARVTDRRENIWRLLADGDWVCTSGPDVGEYLVWQRLAAERGPLSVEVES